MVCKSTDGPKVLQQIRHISSKEKIPPLNSSGVERKGVKAEPLFSWLKSGWTKFLMYCVFVFTFLSVYAPQAGLQEAEKDRFYNQLQSVMARIPVSEVLIPLGDWNGHVGADNNGFEEVHHGKGFGIQNV